MRFIFPPRPVSKISPNTLSQYQKEPWIGQYKINGTRNPIHIIRDQGLVECWERTGEEHKQWKMSADVKDQLLSLNLEFNEYWLDSELLNSKTTDPYYKNRIVLYDVLFADKYLMRGPTTLQRLDLLSTICRNPDKKEAKNELAFVVSENVWMLETFSHASLVEEYNRHIDLKEVEGLVLKDSTAVIDNLGQRYYETSWQLRCRKTHKNYAF